MNYKNQNTESYTMMKFQCVRDKESILQGSREKKRVSYKGIKMTVDLPTTMEVRRLQRRATTSNLEFFYSTKLSIKCEGRRKIFSVMSPNFVSHRLHLRKLLWSICSTKNLGVDQGRKRGAQGKEDPVWERREAPVRQWGENPSQQLCSQPGKHPVQTGPARSSRTISSRKWDE